MDQVSLTVNMALNGWNAQISRADQVFNSFSESEFYKPIAPGKNRIIYLFGHLAAYHDALKDTLGLGHRERPELYTTFLKNSDDINAVMPSVTELRQYWTLVHNQLQDLFTGLSAQDWFARHNTMTDEDFLKDPSRNRLSVLLNRTNHVAYHLGQVRLVKPEKI